MNLATYLIIDKPLYNNLSNASNLFHLIVNSVILAYLSMHYLARIFKIIFYNILMFNNIRTNYRQIFRLH